MEITTTLFSLFLVTVSVGLTIGHVRTWRHEKTVVGDEKRLQYSRRTFRRRMQASIMIGIAGVAIFGGQFLPIARPLLVSAYWAGVVLWVIWIALLALADMLATRHHFAQVKYDHALEEARMRVELRRHGHQGNGHDDQVPPGGNSR